MNNQQKALQALIEKPSTYKIDVQDNSMLPEELKEKKVIELTIKPPSLGVLSMCADLFHNIPENLLKEGAKININDVLPHVNTMVKVVCRLSWNRQADYPEWHEAFILKNATGKEIFMLFQETALKSQTDFFLTSFQIANQTNPMMMKKYRKDSTRSDL